MDSVPASGDDQHDPPLRLFERLRQIAGYTWDESVSPVHLTYDSWNVLGTRFVSPYSTKSVSSHNASSPGSTSRQHSGRHSPLENQNAQNDGSDGPTSTQLPRPASLTPSATPEVQLVEEPVVARISYHALREERLFNVAKTLTTTTDPEGRHSAKPIDLIRLGSIPGDRGLMVVSIWQHPGQNYLIDVLDMGPACFAAQRVGENLVAGPPLKPTGTIGLDRFLEFAIGAAKCLEILHHGLNMIHGEIRGDAFHYNIEDGTVRIASFGSGVRSFEHGLTSAGWSTLSKELGAMNKLLYISPEQTGRMPAEPDSRTDIYSLGVLLWMLLAQQPVFEGDSPMDIVQGVLGRRIPNVSTIRLDVPDCIGRIIQKCTAKNIADRYHSASGLRTDLVTVQKHLADADWEALKELQIGTKDVSSFFMLPTTMFGRQREKDEIIKVIDRVAKSHAISKRAQAHRFSDGSTLSNEVVLHDDMSSEGASSASATDRRSGSFSQALDLANGQRHSANPSGYSDAPTASTDTISTTLSGTVSRPPKPWERHQSLSTDSRSLVGSFGTDGNRASLIDSTTTSLSRQLGSAKFRRRGHCEVITIEGAGGLGKSCLVQAVLADARRRGYCATAKFDAARKTAFGPLLKLLSSLFKQVWGERNTETPFHQMLKQYIRPVWPMLHRVLNLPEFLLGRPEAALIHSPSSMPPPTSSASRPISRVVPRRRGSSPGNSPTPIRASSIPSQNSQEFLRSGSSTKTTRLMNVFLDVLRVFTQHKFICFCLDDLHFADEESLELISQIVGTRMKMVVMMTYRPEELGSERMHSLLAPTDQEDHPRASGPMVTRISLAPLTEQDIFDYVASTLCRQKEEILPLALVIQAKSGGNPFYMREMLSTCHRKKCIWYDYRDSQWHFDLDKLFDQFKGEKDYDVLDTAFITRRLGELPATARSLLAWAALLGNTFSFELVARLMSGEFEYDKSEFSTCSKLQQRGWTERDAIAGLQAAVQSYIILPEETDDRFRFAHDRYIHASAALEECNSRPMHFIIAQTLLKYYTEQERQRESTASHICEAAEIIRRQESHRRLYRKHLTERGRAATESGARPTAAKYYKTAIQLLQDDPWTDGLSDVSYDETLQLFLRSAECYLYMGQHEPATACLGTIFTHAKTVLDKAPAYVLQSRIYAQRGDSQAALRALKECLSALNVPIDEEPTWQTCDERFEKLSVHLQTKDRAVNSKPTKEVDPTLASIGAILSETVTAALWSDRLRYYHLTLVMMEMHLSQGFFPNSGMAFLYLAVVSISRFGMAQFAIDLGEEAQELLSRGRDHFSLSQDLMLHACYVGHLSYPMGKLLTQMEDAVELASTAGDRMSTILSYGLYCQYKFFASDNCADLEAFCEFGCEEISDWDHDVRGGPLLLAVRQTCRALLGKTRTDDPLGVLSDATHESESYKRWLSSLVHQTSRSSILYESMELVPLFLYGHYDRAIEIGNRCVENLGALWSARNSRLILLFHGLALAGKVLRQLQDPVSPLRDQSRIDEVVQTLLGYVKLIDTWNSASNINYLCWSRLIKAQASELSKDHGIAVENYEEALDHAAEHDFIFEEALGNYVMAGFFIRRKARRSARAALAEAVASYRLMGATGVAKSIEEEHSLLLHGPTRTSRMVDAGIQTDFTADSTTVPFHSVDGVDGAELSQLPYTTMTENKGDRIGAWRGSMNMQPEAGAGLPALDMIDLHAILVSSQVISSVLNVDDLLKTMCDNILQTCGGSANLAAIIVQEDPSSETWCVAASGDPERGASAHKPGLALGGTSLIVENVVLYCTRFRETVFVPDLISDERFGNVSDSWLQRNPLGKAIIAIPISHGQDSMFGVLYLEGQPGSFTDRNVAVLQLLVNQIGISYANAMAMKSLEKVSAENRSMVSVQKGALQKALHAERKAKDAEAEAKRNVKLAEEAAKAKSIFLANVSHELRTPLNGVIGNSELLRDSALNKEQMEMADSIRVSADLLLTVINDILDFSKMEADKMKLYIIAFNPAEMVREVVRAVSYSNREKTSKKNVKIVQDINLPPMLIYGDPIRLHQVLGNLIGNSLKFTEDGSITIGARLDSDTEHAATLTFWVRDTGIGIPEQQLVKLFQPFSQADASTARKYGGSGLGLSICKSLIETMMKGEIQLESEESVGTTAWFTVTFEKTKSDVAAGDAQATTSPPIDRFATGQSPFDSLEVPSTYVDLSKLPKEEVRICIAEDNPINQKIAIQYVQRLGYHNVSAYENGIKAVEGLRQKAKEGRPYHIVLMDVMMPVLDGYEATKLLRKDPIEAVRKILVIAMTASAIQGDREKCLAAGMNDYLAKPVRSEVLKKKLDTYLNAPSDSEGNEQLEPNGRGYKPTPPNPADHHPERTIVDDPMGEDAIYNRPLDATSLQARESPIQDATALLPGEGPDYVRPPQPVSYPSSQTSSEHRGSDGGLEGQQSGDNNTGAGSTATKRFARKLTKSRAGSQVSVDRTTNASTSTVDKQPAERSRSVLTKRSLQKQSVSNAAGEDGRAA